MTDFIRKDELPKLIEEYFISKMENSVVNIAYTDDAFGREAEKLGIPKYKYFGEDAGFDLRTVLSEEDRATGLRIFPNERVMLHTGMIMEFPLGYWGRIIHRSSTEKRHRLRIIEGVIDQYRAEIIVQAHNMNEFIIELEHGQHLAQMILSPVCCFKIQKATGPLRPSARMGFGFGHSGK